MDGLQSAVSFGGANLGADVKSVQTLINRCITYIAPLTPLTISGTCDPATAQAISEFQRRVLKSSHPDGRVDPAGRTWTSTNRRRRFGTVLYTCYRGWENPIRWAYLDWHGLLVQR